MKYQMNNHDVSLSTLDYSFFLSFHFIIYTSRLVLGSHVADLLVQTQRENENKKMLMRNNGVTPRKKH